MCLGISHVKRNIKKKKRFVPSKKTSVFWVTCYQFSENCIRILLMQTCDFQFCSFLASPYNVYLGFGFTFLRA